MIAIFKAISAVITTACNVVVKLLSSAERGANALDELSKAGEIKAKNFTALVKLNDEAEFAKRQDEINQNRMRAGIDVVKLESQQAKEERQEKELSEAAKKASEALA